MALPIRQYSDLLAVYLRPQWHRVALLAILLFGTIGLQLVSPQIVRDFIDTASSGASTQLLMRIGLLYLLVTLANQILRTGTAYLTEDVKWRATNWLRNDLACHCLKLDMAFHNEHTPGAMIERIDGDVNELSNFFSQFVIRILGNSVLLIGILVLLTREDWRIGLAFALFAVVMVATLLGTVSLGVAPWRARRQASSELYGLTEEWLGGTEDIGANGGEAYVMQQLQRTFHTLYVASRKAFLIGSLTWGSNSIFFGISTALALGMGGYLWSIGEITIGTVYLILAYAYALQRPLEELARELKDLQAATASVGRVRELLAIEPAIRVVEPEAVLPYTALAVDFDGVTFSYEDDEPILHDISFSLAPGNVLGLLGRTGSGKTTMTRLLFRLYDPTAGVIRLGDQDVKHVTPQELRHHVGIVTQNVQLFQATVRDNLTFFNAAIPDERVEETIHQLGLESWLDALPRGLDTRLNSGGQGLSAGEAQLLAFARIYLKDPGLIILDEASSRLDPVTEQLIEHAIDRLLQGRTAIIVAHRLATVQRADRILILEDGHILEEGDRVALVADPASRFSGLLRAGMEEVLA